MRLERALADQAARAYPDKGGELAVDQHASPVLPGHADQSGKGIVEGLRDGPAAERIGEPFENLQVGGAVIDDDDQLRRHRRTPRVAALLTILDVLQRTPYLGVSGPGKARESQWLVFSNSDASRPRTAQARDGDSAGLPQRR